MKDWEPVDYIVAGLAVTIILTLTLPLISTILFGIPITDAKAKIIAGITASIIAIISLYVGNKLK